MKYTEALTERLKAEYLESRRQGLTNEEAIDAILAISEFSDKTVKSIRAKLGSMKVYYPNGEVKATNKTWLVNEYMTMIGLPKRHFEAISRLNKDTLEDMIELEKVRRNVTE